MPQPEGRTIHDADSHVVATAEWVLRFADPGLRHRLQPLRPATARPGQESLLEELRRRRAAGPSDGGDEGSSDAPGGDASGGLDAEDRAQALDMLGVASQMVFADFAHGEMRRAEHGDDLDYAYGLARAHNRALVDFCSVDSRLLAVGYVPLADFDLARSMAAEVVETGAKALMIASACPRRHSTSHIGLDPVWAQAQEAGLPVVLHVGGGGQLLDPTYFNNGVPAVPAFLGRSESLRSIEYVAVPHPPMQTLAAMIIDGVLERFPRLKVGVIEQGASWVPGWMGTMDASHATLLRSEERLQRLALRPSEYVRRQVRVTPHQHEDVAWIVANAGEEICLFSSVYPSGEGEGDPVGHFGEALAGLPEGAKDRFFAGNFADLMGAGLAVA